MVVSLIDSYVWKLVIWRPNATAKIQIAENNRKVWISDAVTRGKTDNTMTKEEGQTIQWPKEEGHTIQWPKEEGQTTQWRKEEGQTIQWPKEEGQTIQWPKEEVQTIQWQKEV